MRALILAALAASLLAGSASADETFPTVVELVAKGNASEFDLPLMETIAVRCLSLGVAIQQAKPTTDSLSMVSDASLNEQMRSAAMAVAFIKNAQDPTFVDKPEGELAAWLQPQILANVEGYTKLNNAEGSIGAMLSDQAACAATFASGRLNF